MICPNVKPGETIGLSYRRKKNPDLADVGISAAACKRRSCPGCAPWMLDRDVEGWRAGAEHIGLRGAWVAEVSARAALKTIDTRFQRLGKAPVELAEPAIHGPLHSPLHLPPKPPPDPPKPGDWLDPPEKSPLTSTLWQFLDLRGTTYVDISHKHLVTTHIRPQRLTLTTEAFSVILSTHDLSTRTTTFRYVDLAEAFQTWRQIDPVTVKRIDGTRPRTVDPNPHQWRSRVEKPDVAFLGKGPASVLIPALAEAIGVDEEGLTRPIKAEDAEAVRRATYVQMMD